MKKQSKKLFTFAVVLMLVMCLATFFVSAEDETETETETTYTYGDFYYEMPSENTITITGYAGEGGVVEIPAAIENVPVTAIGDEAFLYCDTITEITIPDSITSIGVKAFCMCKGLTSLTIPDSVTTISNQAFGLCTNLESIVLPKKLSKITEFMISGCKSLKSITLPENIKTIEQFAFYDCQALESVILPEKTGNIGVGAFEGCENLKTITLGAGLHTIESGAFEDCSNIETIYYTGDIASWCLVACLSAESTPWCIADEFYIDGEILSGDLVIPYGVTTIESNAFYGCDKITSVTIPETVTWIRSEAFRACVNLKEVNFSEGLTGISLSAFMSCPNLTEVVIPDSVKTIGMYAFYYCSNLKTVKIGTGLENFTGEYEFAGTALTEIIIDENNPNFMSEDGVMFSKDKTLLVCYPCAKEGTKYIIPNTVTYVGYRAFLACKNLKTIVAQEGVETLGTTAFYSDSLEKIYIPKSVTTIYKDLIRSKTEVYYGGTAEDWALITINTPNTNLLNAKIHYVGCNDYQGSVTTKPTCTKTGVMTYSCNCGYSYTEDIPATGHTTVIDAAVSATCTTNGKTEGSHCSSCGTVFAYQNTIKATGHTTVIDAAVSATCTTNGKTEGSHCSSCGTVFAYQNTIIATGHSDANNDNVCDKCADILQTEDDNNNLNFFEKIKQFIQKIMDWFKNLFS